MTQSRRPTPQQRRVLIVLAALDEKTTRPRADAGHRTGAGAKRGSPSLRAKPARLLPSPGGCRLAAHPASPESAAGSGADGRRPGRGTASAAGRTEAPPGRTACAEVVVLPLVPACRSARRRHFCH